MSIEALTWAMNQQKTKDSTARQVLWVYANFANEQGDAWPSVPTIVRQTCLTDRCVRTKIRVLEEQGLMSTGNQALAAHYFGHSGHRPVVYRLHIEVVKTGREAAEEFAENRAAETLAKRKKQDVEPVEAAQPDSVPELLPQQNRPEPGAGQAPIAAGRPERGAGQAVADRQNRPEPGAGLGGTSFRPDLNVVPTRPEPRSAYPSSDPSSNPGIEPSEESAHSEPVGAKGRVAKRVPARAAFTADQFSSRLVELGADPQVVADWLQVRRLKKAANTVTALTDFLTEVEKVGCTVEDAVKLCAVRQWQGFNAKWPAAMALRPGQAAVVEPRRGGMRANEMTADEMDAYEAEQLAKLAARRGRHGVDDFDDGMTIDMQPSSPSPRPLLGGM